MSAAVVQIRSARRRRLGFTLMELLVSMAMSTVIIGALTSLVLISVRALPSSDHPVHASVNASRLLTRLSSELMYARHIHQADPDSIMFDLDRDGTLTTVTYSWAGPGSPILRRTSDSTATMTMLESAQDFALEYIVETKEITNKATEVEGPEQLLLRQDETNSGTGTYLGLGSNSRYAIKFRPVVPAEATSWRITRVQAILSPKNPTNGTVSVSIREASGNGKPKNTSVDEVLVPESSLATDTWYEVSFPNAGGLDPATGYNVVFENTGGGTAAYLTIGESSTGSPETEFWEDSGGGTWAGDPARDIWIWIWGRFASTDPNFQSSQEGFVRSIQVTVDPTGHPGGAVETTVMTLNDPEINS